MSVSVVMATYNGARYIEEQLDSILKQLTEADEIVICDDCSKDNTVDVIHRYAGKHPLGHIIRVVCNPENLGFENNFRQVMSMAEKDMIFFADQDDIWLEDKIRKMVDVLSAQDDCQLVCCDYEPFCSSANAPKPPRDLARRMPNNGVLEKVDLTKQSIYIGQLGCCMGMRKSFRDRMTAYWFEGWAQDDRCWRLALADNGLYVLHENLVLHRLHDHNTSTYGKYHTLQKRIHLFQSMYEADCMMLAWMKENDNGGRAKIVEKNRKMMKQRIRMLQSRNILRSIPLFRYLSYYQAKKSYLVEIFMAIKGR